jgi:6-pyruvoyltetrahydropterin/6-carboxytetrahydropterin synthase
MYRTGLSSRLASRHFLADASPREGIEHYHDYLVEVTVSGSELDGKGYLIDIDMLRSALSGVLERYRDRCLNELPEFASSPPSLENLAREVHHRLGAALGDRTWSIEVRVWEDPEAWASYEGAWG